MPELPDVENYCRALNRLVCGQTLVEIELLSPFLLRTVTPSLKDFEGRRLLTASREAKQILLQFEGGQRLLIHLMIAGRLRWRAREKKVPKSNLLALFHFAEGTLLFTEAGKKRRARLYALSEDEAALEPFRKGGLDILDCSLAEFGERLVSVNHTLRRSLTDQSLFSGIGNAYSDEILFEAGLSPLKLSQKLGPEEIETLYGACRSVLLDWVGRLAQEVGSGFPEKVTAFHPEMMVHGRYGQACKRCDASVQRIRYAENETNYCPSCQNEGRLLADRSLSRLLKSDWPRTPEELEYHLEKRKI